MRDPAQRKEYASWILAELDETKRICEVSRHCREVRNAVGDVYVDWENESLSLEQWRRIWEKPQDAQEVVGADAGFAR